MNALYTAYFEVRFDRTGEGDYATKVYSLDCRSEDLAFISQLPNASSFGNEDSLLQVAIHHSSSVARTPASEHFDSLEKLLVHFGSIHFKKKDQ